MKLLHYVTEGTTIYGFALLLVGILGLSLPFITPETGSSLIGAALPLLLPNKTPLYPLLKAPITALTSFLSQKEKIMTDINTPTTEPTIQAESQKGLASVIDKILAEFHHKPLSSRQEAAITLLQECLTPLLEIGEEELSKKYDMSQIKTGVKDVFGGLDQLDTAYQTLKNAFHPPKQEEVKHATP